MIRGFRIFQIDTATKEDKRRSVDGNKQSWDGDNGWRNRLAQKIINGIIFVNIAYLS